MKRFRLSPQAAADLAAIWTYIAVEDYSPGAADGLLDRIFGHFLTLAEHPLIGRERPEFGPGLRMFPLARYLVFYRVDADAPIVEIVRVLHASRELDHLFEE